MSRDRLPGLVGPASTYDAWVTWQRKVTGAPMPEMPVLTPKKKRARRKVKP